ncbi:MAG TPA: HPr family phosphocarrier protein [Egibacteraceae bacterium]|jgi:phosphocarrier protein HPr|nr:HPr family phosphocarrier protein [Egibacteraceae bacterium]
MPSKTVTLTNPTGLHARPAAVFAKAAAAHPCAVTVAKGERTVNAKSVLSVLTLDCHQGDELTIATDGEGEDTALDELVALVESGIGE